MCQHGAVYCGLWWYGTIGGSPWFFVDEAFFHYISVVWAAPALDLADQFLKK